MRTDILYTAVQISKTSRPLVAMPPEQLFFRFEILLILKERYHFLSRRSPLLTRRCTFAAASVKGRFNAKLSPSVLSHLAASSRRFTRAASLLFVLLFLISGIDATAAPDGKALFQANCASCHNPLKDATGPALKGVDARVPGKEWLYNWIHNPAGMIASGDAYANKIYNEWGKTQMTSFPQLANEEIDAIIAYVNSV